MYIKQDLAKHQVDQIFRYYVDSTYGKGLAMHSKTESNCP